MKLKDNNESTIRFFFNISLVSLFLCRELGIVSWFLGFLVFFFFFFFSPPFMLVSFFVFDSFFFAHTFYGHGVAQDPEGLFPCILGHEAAG